MIATYHLDGIEILGTANKGVGLYFEFMRLYGGAIDVVVGLSTPKEFS